MPYFEATLFRKSYTSLLVVQAEGKSSSTPLYAFESNGHNVMVAGTAGNGFSRIHKLQQRHLGVRILHVLRGPDGS